MITIGLEDKKKGKMALAYLNYFVAFGLSAFGIFDISKGSWKPTKTGLAFLVAGSMFLVLAEILSFINVSILEVLGPFLR